MTPILPDEGQNALSMTLSFEKYEGLGNDFLIVDDPHLVDWLSERGDACQALCDRHLGVGADGVLLLKERDGRFEMKVINADGSVAKMCGNGLRCAALHFFRRGLVGTERFEMQTGAGPHGCQVQMPEQSLGDRSAGVASVLVEMRAPTTQPSTLPLNAAEPWIEHPLQVAGHGLSITAVSMGNPHAVIFDEVGDAARELGPLLEHHAAFPDRVNVGFARLEDSTLVLKVWERGAGFTQACGTGACAAAFAAVLTGRAPQDQPLLVRLPGGELEIEIGESGQRARMRGPARHVFSGQLEI